MVLLVFLRFTPFVLLILLTASNIPSLLAFVLVGSGVRTIGGGRRNEKSCPVLFLIPNVDLSSLEELRNKSVKELKQELQTRQIPIHDIFEKEQLVQRLYAAIVVVSNANKPQPPDESITNHNNFKDRNDDIVRVPLRWMSLRGIVDTKDASIPDGFQFRPTDRPFPTVELDLLLLDGGKEKKKLNLLVDTACSGAVLQSNAVIRCHLPRKPNPVTSMGASGTAESTSLSEIPKFAMGGQTFGPLPAAVQNLDSLPAAIDGIMGLSSLGQFDTVEFDLAASRLNLYKKDAPPPPKDLVVVAQGDLKLLGSTGIYVVDVYWGGRGPVSMIVDTGGSNTFLSWKGVKDMGLTRESKGVYPITDPLGAMGNTGQVFDLTHRLFVSSQLQLGSSQWSVGGTGLSLAGNARLAIDIGNIPLLQMLATQNVGGILGLDVFTQCKAVRLKLKSNRRTLTLLQ